MDLNDLQQICGPLGLTPEKVKALMQDPQMQASLQHLSSMMEQAGITPGDLQGLRVSGTGECPEREAAAAGFDLEAEAAAYQPQPENDADRAFLAALKDWIVQSVSEIPAQDVCMLGIGYEATFGKDDSVCYTVWLSYNTAQTAAQNRARYGSEVWNQINWTDDCFRKLPDAPFAAWRLAQDFDEDHDGDEMITRIYDLAAAAVIELHAAQFTEQRFGRRIPVLIADLEFDPETAVRAVRVNGAECFDAQFLADCGF
jgi:hypothetical protein